MNRFTIACRAFAEGLNTTPSIADTRESIVAATRRSLKAAEDDVARIKRSLADAEKRASGLSTKLEQLQKLPDEAFAVLLS